jgi:hypothetical protein
MVLRRIKYALEDLFDNVAFFFIVIAVYALFVLAVLSPVIIPIVIGYAVFVVISSSFDPLISGVIFAAYSVGIFLYGGIFGFKGCEDVKKEIKNGLDMCEKKVASIMDDVSRCFDVRRRYSRRCSDARSSIESKIFDTLMCFEAVRKKL